MGRKMSGFPCMIASLYVPPWCAHTQLLIGLLLAQPVYAALKIIR